MIPKKEHMQIAIDVAWEGIKNCQSPFGSAIFKENELVLAAHNVVWETTDITAHAEINAIRCACKKLNTIDLSGCVLYSTCEPCPMCFSACHWANFSHVIFGSSIADATAVGFNELIISSEKMKNLGGSSVKLIDSFMRDETQELFEEWNRKFPGKVY